MAVFSAFCVLFTVSTLWAQDSSKVKFLIGPIAGYGSVAYNTNEFPALPSRPTFFIEENGWAPSHFFGISAQIPVISGMDKFLILEAVYDSKSANFSSGAGMANDSLINLSASLSYVLLNVGFKYNFFDTSAITTPKGFGIQAMVSFGWAITHTFTTYYDSVVWVNTNTYPPFYTTNPHSTVSNIDGLNQIRIALRTDLTYDIPISSSWLLTPYAGFDIPLTKVDNTSRDWTASSVYVALALRFQVR